MGRVGPGQEAIHHVFEISRVRLGRVTRLSTITGRVGSGGVRVG